MKKFAVVVSALALAACGSSDSGKFETDDGETGSYHIDRSGDEADIHIKTDEGELHIQSGTGAEADLPRGYSLYPGAKVLSSTRMDRGGGKQGVQVTMQSKASAADMTAFYRKQAEAAGIDIKLEMKTGQGTMISGQAENGDVFSFNANPGDDGTVGSLTVASKMGD